MGVAAIDYAVAVFDVAHRPFNLVSMDVWRGGFYCEWQIEDQALLRRGLNDIHHRLANFFGEIELGAHETFGGILKADGLFHAAFVRHFADKFCGTHGDIPNTSAIFLKHHAALQFGSGIIKMHDGVFRALYAFKGSADQIFTTLHEDLDSHVIGDQIIVDQVAAEIKIRLAGGRKADFDFLKAHFNKRVPHADFAVGAHGFYERLIAVAQIDAAPDWWGGDLGRGPFAARQIDGRKGAVFLGGIYHHDIYVSFCLFRVIGFVPLQRLGKRPEGPQGLISRSFAIMTFDDMGVVYRNLALKANFNHGVVVATDRA